MGSICSMASGREAPEGGPKPEPKPEPKMTQRDEPKPELRRERVVDRESGCYLVFLGDNQLVMHWSESKVEDALAAFYPEKPIPRHKFVTNGGKVELTRQANNKKKYFETICQFVRLAKQQKALLVMQTDLVTLYVHDSNDQVMLVKEGELSELSNADMAIVVPKDSCELKGVNKMNKTHIVSKIGQGGVTSAL
eukprot:TRINITY_DN67666_c0_g1_i1.p1 TRINITY_DN67666_c0_g1~~TRINITY_DN67666_c0_g1_i1.p1  ORF type:complete len:194 (-),score=27.56 TRINITY_DN67666_c0_g1_i1:193-774(-)